MQDTEQETMSAEDMSGEEPKCFLKTLTTPQEEIMTPDSIVGQR